MNILIKINIFLYASLNFEKSRRQEDEIGEVLFINLMTYQYTANRELLY